MEENIPEELVDEREKYWIKYYNSIENGYNILFGGNHSHNFSEKHKKNLQKSLSQKYGHKVICLNTKKIYNSINEAYRETGANHIEQCCLGQLKSAGRDDEGNALIWRYLEDYKPEEIVEIKKQKRKKTKIICLNTGIIYNSLKEASIKTGVDNGSISKCINGKRKSAGKDKNGIPLRWQIIENEKGER